MWLGSHVFGEHVFIMVGTHRLMFPVSARASSLIDVHAHMLSGAQLLAPPWGSLEMSLCPESKGRLPGQCSVYVGSENLNCCLQACEALATVLTPPGEHFPGGAPGPT